MLLPGFLAARWPGLSAILIASLVQHEALDGKLHRLDSIDAQKLRGLDSSTKLRHLRDVRRVHANEQAPNPQGIRPSRWCAVRNTLPQLRTTTIAESVTGLSAMPAFR